MTKRIVTAAMVLVVVLAGLTTITARKALAGSASNTVLLVHGYSASSVMDCNAGSEFGTLKTFLANSGIAQSISLGFYNADYDCDNYIVAGESQYCTGWYDSGSNDGTVNEDIRHTTCLLAWFIWDHYTYYGKHVEVIAHSMGGILIRQAMNDTPYESQFPPYLYITDVATAGSPHQGISSVSAWVDSAPFFGQNCPGNCVEVYQMQQSNGLMSNMNSTSFRSGFGRDPQGSGGTDWTTMSSNKDDALDPSCLLTHSETLGSPSQVSWVGLCGLMPGATHFVDYPGSSDPKYNHGGYLTDTNTAWNASECYSDNSGGTWYCVPDSEHSLYTLTHAILYSSW